MSERKMIIPEFGPFSGLRVISAVLLLPCRMPV